MAKRKSARKPRKKVQKTSSFLSTVKRMFIGAFIVVACFIGVLFIYDYYVPMAGHKPAALEKKGQEVVSSKKAATAPKQKIQDKTSANKTLAKSSTKTFKIPANTEIPRLNGHDRSRNAYNLRSSPSNLSPAGRVQTY